MSYTGAVPGWESHFAGRDADTAHDLKLASLEAKDSTIESKIGHHSKHITTVSGYSYTPDVWSDDNIEILWTGSTIRFRHKMPSSRNLTRTFISPQYNTTGSYNLTQNTDYYLNMSTYDDSSFHATSYGTLTVYLSERDVEKFSYQIRVWYDYYETRLVVTRLS